MKACPSHSKGVFFSKNACLPIYGNRLVTSNMFPVQPMSSFFLNGIPHPTSSIILAIPFYVRSTYLTYVQKPCDFILKHLTANFLPDLHRLFILENYMNCRTTELKRYYIFKTKINVDKYS